MSTGPLSGSKTLSNVFLAAAVVLLALVVKYQARIILKSSQAEFWEGRRYERLKLTGSRTVIGLRQNGTEVSLDQWKLPASDVKTRSWKSAGVPLSALRISRELDYVAWPDGDNVELRELAKPDQSIHLPIQKGAKPLDMGFLQGGSLVVLYSDGMIARWHVNDRTRLSTEQIPLKNPDHMAADEDYIAAASSSEGKLVLYRSSDSAKLHVVEEVRIPAPPFEMVIPGHGQVALLTPGGIFLNGETLNTPGRVRGLAFGSHGDLLAAGDFDGIYAVPKDQKAYKIAAAGAAAAIAANENYLVYSGGEGTRLFEFGSTFQVTSTGQTMLWIVVGAGVVALLMAADRLMFGVRRRIRRIKVKPESGAERRFPDPPAELVQAAATGPLVLWAGSGLSVQAGMPPRQSFVRLILESGRFDHWLASRDSARLEQIFEDSGSEGAMDALIGERSEVTSTVLAQIKTSYPRKGMLSHAHLALNRLTFTAAVTTNYDLLLEQLEGAWPHNVLHLKHNVERDRVRIDRFFLLKLYGDLLRPHTILPSRSEMLRWYREPGGMAPVLQSMMETSTVLFVGCSLEGLLDDLGKLLRPKAPRGRYFAVVAVKDDSWHRKAAELHSRFGVEVMACVEDAMHVALPEFLDRLADAAYARIEELSVSKRA